MSQPDTTAASSNSATIMSHDEDTDSSNDAMKNRLLEAFPLTEYELDYLVKLHDFYLDTDSDEFTLTAWLELSSARNTPHYDMVKEIEENLLPTEFISKLVDTAMAKVFCVGGSGDAGRDEEDLRKFLEAMVTCLGRRGPRGLLDVLKSACPEQDLRLWVYQLALASHVLYSSSDNNDNDISKENLAVVLAAPDSWLKGDESFDAWAATTAPQAYTAISTFLHLALFTNHHPFRPSTPPLCLPRLDRPSSLLKENEHPLAISLALMSPNLGGTWRRLYSSDEDGFSFRTMQQALVGYRGPTVILVRSTSGDVIGFSTDCPWKLSTKWFGQESDSFLFTLHPSVAMYPSTGQGTHHQYLNLPPEHRPQDLKGLAIGGISSDRPRLHIKESLEQCRACSIDTTFASGPLLSDDMEAYFDVSELEVWATHLRKEGDFAHNVERGQLQTAVYEAARTNVAKVDKGQFVDDLASQAFLNKMFDHRQVTAGRHCFSVRDVKEYYDRANESQHGKND